MVSASRPPPPRGATVLVVILLIFACSPARAQDGSVESRLREALRRSTVELRALQDGQAAMQAALDQTKQQNAELSKRIETLSASVAAKPAEAAPDPQLVALRDAVPALQEQNKSLRTDLARLRTAYAQATQAAHVGDAQGRQLDLRLRDSSTRLGLCRQENRHLVSVANDILHLYRTPEFRATVIGSWEPLLGFKQVELQNIEQDYEDKILGHRYIDKAPSAPEAAPAPARKPG